MHVILVSNRLATTRTINLGVKHVVLAVVLLLSTIIGGAVLVSWLTSEFGLSVSEQLGSVAKEQENTKLQGVVRNNLQMMATRLGELQAQVLELDSLGERLSSLAGVKPPTPKTEQKLPVVGKGGPLVLDRLTTESLQEEIDHLTKVVDGRTSYLEALEDVLMEYRVRQRLLPTAMPVPGASLGSGFGYRSDPILGLRALHQGMDFNAPMGSAVLAAAAGVVVSAEYHRDYGNMVDIDHGGELVSRYAHLSAIKVSPGQIVRAGQVVGALGSTGRSTGPHLHFEVRISGVPQNPSRFLEQGRNLARR